MEEVKGLFLEWLEIQYRKEIYDDQVMAEYLFYGNNRKILRSVSGRVYGLNVWDENFKYINYRYCVCGKSDFISEYMRWLFYTDQLILNKDKMRRISTIECERLQGYPDNYTKGISDYQRQIVLGNAVTVPVIEYILSFLKSKEIEFFGEKIVI